MLALLLAAGQAALMAPPVQRFLYYRVWLGFWLRRALRLSGGYEADGTGAVRAGRPRWRWLLWLFDLPYESWVAESARWEPAGAHRAGFPLVPHPPHVPVLVQRDHLGGRYRWPGQSFATVVLFHPVRITRDGGGRCRLDVDLSGEPYGIYKNRGKQFLDHLRPTLQQVMPREEALARSARLHAFLMDAGHEPAETSAGGPSQPLRWSSAGALPLVRWRKPDEATTDDWFALFFRGISPVGWNLASGSAETSREWRSLFEVGVRELCEELVVLEDQPVRDGKPVPEVYRRRFSPSQAVDPGLARRLTGQDFVREHDRLRETQDQITIINDPSRATLRLHEVETHSIIVVRDGSETLRTENAIFTVNPLEAGAECVFVFRFALTDNDYLIFGEVLEDLGALAREPVMLLRRSFAEHQLKQHGSLGELLPGQERKRLPTIPARDYHIFGADIILRERRLRALLHELAIPAGDLNAREAARLRDELIPRQLGAPHGPATQRALLEARFHTNWIAEYGPHFSALTRATPLAAPATGPAPLLELCANTWKTLELVCQHGIGT